MGGSPYDLSYMCVSTRGGKTSLGEYHVGRFPKEKTIILIIIVK